MRRKTVQVVGDPLRLNSYLRILRRKVDGLRTGKPMAPAAYVASVFNQSEVAALKRVARGERTVGVDMTQEHAVEELAWIARGGQYPDEDYEDDGV